MGTVVNQKCPFLKGHLKRFPRKWMNEIRSFSFKTFANFNVLSTKFSIYFRENFVYLCEIFVQFSFHKNRFFIFILFGKLGKLANDQENNNFLIFYFKNRILWKLLRNLIVYQWFSAFLFLFNISATTVICQGC